MLSKTMKVGIYCRLSSEDDSLDESQSIINQKEMISSFVLNKGWKIVNIYIDDGYSGTNFNRPSFNKLIEDIKNKIINCVISKDLSRLGRDYLKTGIYIEYFKENNIRYIALNDNVDTFNELDDFVPFKNIINEMYAKDISKKIHFTLDKQIQNGIDKNSGVPLYGYKYINDTRIEDKNTSPIVKKIFSLFINGYSYSSIAKYLKSKQVYTPLYYNYLYNNFNHHKTNYRFVNGPYAWNVETIRRILKNDAYIGTLTRGKTKKKFKSNKQKIVKEDDRYKFKNKFVSLIDLNTFNKAQELINMNPHKFKKPYKNKYAGFIRCAICNKPLKYKVDKRKNAEYERLTCSNKCGDNKGTILIDDLECIIKKELFLIKDNLITHLDLFYQLLKNSYDKLLDSKDELSKHEEKIDCFIKEALEEYTNQILPKDTYLNLLNYYHQEKEKIHALQKETELNLNKTNYINNTHKIINFFNNLNTNNYFDVNYLKSIIKDISIKTDGMKKRREKMQKEVNINYAFFNDTIREFKNAF